MRKKFCFIKVISFVLLFFYAHFSAAGKITCQSLFTDKVYQLHQAEASFYNGVSLTGRSYSPSAESGQIGKLYERSQEMFNLTFATERLQTVKFNPSMNRRKLLAQLETDKVAAFYIANDSSEYYKEIGQQVYHWEPAGMLAETEFSSILEIYNDEVFAKKEVRLIQLKNSNNEPVNIGLFILSVLSNNPKVVLAGTLIFDEYQGKGYATELWQSLIGVLKAAQSPEAIVEYVLSSNAASIALNDKLGFVEVETFIRDHRPSIKYKLDL